MNRLILTATLAFGTALAQAQSIPYYIGISQTLTHEDNLLRLRDGAATPEGLSRRDTVSTTALVAGIDQTFGRQKLSGSASVRANRYDNNDVYDTEGYNLRLGLDWETIGSLSGAISLAGDRQQRADLRDRNGAFIVGDNSETFTDVGFTVRYGVYGPWAVTASANWRRDDFEAPGSDFREYEQTAGSAGVRWRPGAATELGLGVTRSRIDYPSFFATGERNDRRTSDSVDFNVSWVPSGASQLVGRLSRSRTEYNPFPDRNFSASTGALQWLWLPTGRLRFDTRLSRDVGQDSDRATTAFSRITETLRIGAEYAASAKVAVSLSAAVYRRELIGNGFFTVGTTGKDEGHDLRLGVRWAALRSLSVGCNVGREVLRANDNPALNDAFKANSASCFGQFVLQ